MSWVGNDAGAFAVDEQVELLEHGLSDENFISEHQGFLQGVLPWLASIISREWRPAARSAAEVFCTVIAS